MSRLIKKSSNVNGYSVQQTSKGVQVSKIAPYDNTEYYWGIYIEEKDEASVYRNGSLINTISAESVQDLINELVMANSALKPQIDKS